ncbi:hypothetical protein EOT10_09820 [Streptomyces antnestii]|uniref:Uncharacterized protein n=1 Tax=Streptomyces antnestii TaxID=2494256 RepID=A0A3S3UII2_9ACTN|nr:hypothetical protein EOT10_09820 [Streptomyces sp. San01]
MRGVLAAALDDVLGERGERVAARSETVLEELLHVLPGVAPPERVGVVAPLPVLHGRGAQDGREDGGRGGGAPPVERLEGADRAAGPGVGSGSLGGGGGGGARGGGLGGGGAVGGRVGRGRDGHRDGDESGGGEDTQSGLEHGGNPSVDQLDGLFITA